MSAVSKKKPNNKLQLSVQFVAQSDNAPSRPQIRKWAAATLQRDAEITVRIVDEEEGRTLNREYRQKDYATNVLTFVYDEDFGIPEMPLTGDLVLCTQVVNREAQEQHISVEAHYAHLIVHGVLHLQGYDHENDADAEEMEALESEIVIKLGYADPYGGEK